MIKQRTELIRAFQEMKENALSQGILVPLFRAFGYPQVEFHGGPDEQGKDIICWRRDHLDEIELAASKFYSAEDYHQKYLVKNPGGYNCHVLRD